LSDRNEIEIDEILNRMEVLEENLAPAAMLGVALVELLLEKNVITQKELQAKLDEMMEEGE